MQSRRKINSRPLPKRVLILCEGTETEPIYFKGIRSEHLLSLKQRNLLVDIPDNKFSTSKELVKLAKQMKKDAEEENRPYVAIWIVVDRDQYSKHHLAFNQAKALGIHIAFSSIAFEYWFLLHFKYTTRPFAKADDLIKELKAAGYVGYNKTANHYEKLKTLTTTAIDHAKKMKKSLENSNFEEVYKRNPYTNVDKLVEYLLGL